MLHTNTLLASRQVERFNRRNLILDAYNKSSSPLTDRQVMRLCHYDDMNAIRPRITELIDDGVLMEVGTTTDETTGKRVRLVARSYKWQQGEMSF
jgi:hypothetical protein